MKKDKIKIFSTILTAVTGILLAVSPAFAHVVVRPAQVGVGAFQTFTVGVPNEKDKATVAVRLVLPEGLGHVSPNVKPGWTIELVHEEAKAMEGESAMEGDDDHASEAVKEKVSL
jgi:uncharacterized protein YcnI